MDLTLCMSVIFRANRGQPEYILIGLFRPIGSRQHGVSLLCNVIHLTELMNVLYIRLVHEGKAM